MYLAGGIQSYNLTTGKSFTKVLPAGNRQYIVSYWSRNGALTVTINGNATSATAGLTKNGWTYYSHLLLTGTNVSITATNAIIDELRLYPSDALMTTYTYIPLIGMSSTCTPNNYISYYEYDNFNRLKVVRDMDKNILKQYDYQYNVPASTSALWQSTGLLRCKPCSTNTSYTINMQQHEEKDMNPSSSTYNNIRWVDDGIAGSCVITPGWQNTTTALRCQKDANNQNTGSQEQEQKDMNPCSPTFNNLRWIVSGYNATACPPPATTVNITGYNSVGESGFTVRYTHVVSGLVYTFNIGTGMAPQNLGSIPSGTYNVRIRKPGNTNFYYFDIGCSYLDGEMADFYNVVINSSTCNIASIQNGY
jgi:hypothetical protein